MTRTFNSHRSSKKWESPKPFMYFADYITSTAIFFRMVLEGRFRMPFESQKELQSYITGVRDS